MSEEVQNTALEVLPESNDDHAVFVDPAAEQNQPAADVEPPAHASESDKEATDELKAIAKALMVNLTWSLGGLFNKQ